MFIYFLPKNT